MFTIRQTLLPSPGGWGSQSEWLKSYTCWVPEHIVFSSTSTHFWRKRVGPHMTKGCMDFPSVPNTVKCFSLNKLVSWSFKDFIILWKGGTSVRTWLKDYPSHLDFLSTVTLECHLSSPFTPVFLYGASLLLPRVLILCGSFQLTHFVSVIRHIRRSKITVSVVSHSLRSTGLLSKIAPLDCSAWGIIDQYPVCSLFYIWLVNLTHSVPISYAVLAHLPGLRI